MGRSPLWLAGACLLLIATVSCKPGKTVSESAAVKSEIGHKRADPAPATPTTPAPEALDADGKLTEITRKKLLAEINKYRMMHDATPLGYCPACVDAAQERVDKIAASGDIKADHTSKYGQTVFNTKDPQALSQGADYLGTLVAATWYNQIKNYDWVKGEFKGNAQDFTQLVWEASEVVGFASAKATDGTVYIIAYYNPAGNNETMTFVENVNRVTGAGDIESVPGRMKCPDGWKLSGVDCYKLFDTNSMVWGDAADHCNVLKASLASAETPEDGQLIRSMLTETEKGAWIGMSDTAMKGGFQFIDGTPYVYSDWSYESYQWLYANQDQARGKCIVASKEGWSYKDCDKKLPFLCKSRPNGVLSYSVDFYFPGSTYTDDLAQPGTKRFTTLKTDIDKAINASYGTDIWFDGDTFYQFMPREPGNEAAASTMLKFVPDIREPVDPISKLREYLRKQDDVKILKVRLIPGSGRVSQTQPVTGTCPSGCSGDCYPECNPTCCGSAVQLAQPPVPSGYTACPQFQGCGSSCQSSCSQSCCAANTMQPQMAMPQMMPAPVQAAPAYSPYMAPAQPAQGGCPAQPGCSASCAPQCSSSCCQQSMAMQQPRPMAMAAPVQQMQVAMSPPQVSVMPMTPQFAPQPMAPQPMNACSGISPGCSAACAPACRANCCSGTGMRSLIGMKKSKLAHAKNHKKSHSKL